MLCIVFGPTYQWWRIIFKIRQSGSRSSPKSHHFVLVFYPLHQISPEFLNNFFRYPVDRSIYIPDNIWLYRQPFVSFSIDALFILARLSHWCSVCSLPYHYCHRQGNTRKYKEIRHRRRPLGSLCLSISGSIYIPFHPQRPQVPT